jgi:hypothetical protein
MATVVRAKSNSTETGPADAVAPAPKPGRTFLIKLALFVASLLVSVAAFITIDYFYSKAILGSAVAGGAHGFCFSRDPVRAFGFLPNCSCMRPLAGLLVRVQDQQPGI